jgi:hypothetical protein
MEYKIAVTTSDHGRAAGTAAGAADGAIDLKFGQAGCFSIYTVDSGSGEYTLSEKRVIDEATFKDGGPENEEYGACNGARVEYIAKLLSDCDYLLTAKIGDRPHRDLLRYGISALETPYPLGFAVKKLNDYKRGNRKK